MAGEDVAARVKKKLSFLQDPFWEERILGVLLYGSQVRGEAGPRSDIDLCLVAPQATDRAALWRKFISLLRDDQYDVHIFEILPLHIKMSVIEEGVVLHSRDVLELYEYFYPFRREWEDQKHRHTLAPEEMRSLIAAARRERSKLQIRKGSQSSSRA
ncbi:MAG: nucleotidyltransferase domain-containing protein [Methanotrichaceae archaeon]|nr:nucleotidyltransferase domain-containing protein [Methanotrichaceae archaeon]